MTTAMQSHPDQPVLTLPAGRFFAGSTTPLIVVPAALDSGRVLAEVARATAEAPLNRPQRALVVATVNSVEGPRYYGMDRRRARLYLASANAGASLMVPPAYELDDFTLAIAWAVTNIDDALLDDDSALATASMQFSGLRGAVRSSIANDGAADLSAVSQACRHPHTETGNQLVGQVKESTKAGAVPS
ncbi:MULTISPECIES: hypothetical protein [Nocardia]|uniref:hypothetical protein n=1 Tax=Nocardia TaxID=1817 RepID=UPI0012D73D75|nr:MULTISPECIES: hypothetical protein [Nocardia]MBF6278727.1 hypothetical protein [Nocardia nova]